MPHENVLLHVTISCYFIYNGRCGREEDFAANPAGHEGSLAYAVDSPDHLPDRPSRANDVPNQISDALAHVASLRISGTVDISGSNAISVVSAEPTADSNPDSHTNRAAPDNPPKCHAATIAHSCSNAVSIHDR